MTCLLDTHVILWALLSPQKLSKVHRDILTSKDYPKAISTISIWEISLKFSLGKLDLLGKQPEGILNECINLGYEILPQTPLDFATFHRLPKVEGHRDPFDRMLVWQTVRQGLTLLSHDNQLSSYKIHGLKLS